MFVSHLLEPQRAKMLQDANKEINEADSYISSLSLSILGEAVSYVVVLQNKPSVQRHDGTKRSFKLNVTSGIQCYCAFVLCTYGEQILSVFLFI